LNLNNPSNFFAIVRDQEFSGNMTQSQVNGFNYILGAIPSIWPTDWAAYALATAVWETAATIGVANNTLPAGGTNGENLFQTTFTTGANADIPTGSKYVSISGSATYYLIAYSTFAVSTMAAYGQIQAIRQP